MHAMCLNLCVISTMTVLLAVAAATTDTARLWRVRDLQEWSTLMQLTSIRLNLNSLTGTLPQVRGRGVRNAAFERHLVHGWDGGQNLPRCLQA